MRGLTVVGAGLIGCSFAAAARAADLFDHIEAVEPDPQSAARALELGLVDALATEPAPEWPVLLACPSDQIVAWLVRLAGHEDVIFDAASVKGAIIEQLAAANVEIPRGYVPCHPIAGRETSGPDAADADLFRDRLTIITPTAATDPACTERVAGWWRALGARVEQMDPRRHDEIYARTSHLPHLLAFAYLLGIDAEQLPHSGGGFRDFSRIGASDPDMWSAIFDLNRDALLTALADFRSHLDEFAAAIAQRDKAASRRLIAAARDRRAGLED